MPSQASELDLLTFFAVEPKKVAATDPRPYDRLTYEVDRGGAHLQFVFEPEYGDAAIRISRGDVLVYELRIRGCAHVTYHKHGSAEHLQIVMGENEALQLRIDPGIVLTHQVGA